MTRFDDIARSERYFTATLLPVILFHAWDSRVGLNNFINLIDSKSSEVGTERSPSGERVPIGTREYGGFIDPEIISEFHIARDLRRPRVDNERRDAPDIVVISGTELIVCEAKFFDRFNTDDLNTQLQSQREKIRYLFSDRPDIRAYRHIVIVPRIPRQSIDADAVLTWQDIATLSANTLGHSHYVTKRFEASLSKYNAIIVDPDKQNYNGTLSLKDMIAKCQESGPGIQIGYDKGGASGLLTLDIEAIRRRPRWKWRDNDNNGVIDARNWMTGSVWLSIVLGKIAAEPLLPEGSPVNPQG